MSLDGPVGLGVRGGCQRPSGERGEGRAQKGALLCVRAGRRYIWFSFEPLSCSRVGTD